MERGEKSTERPYPTVRTTSYAPSITYGTSVIGDNPFKTPLHSSRGSLAPSRPGSVRSAAVSYAATERAQPPKQRKFKSARLIGVYDKPWTLKKDPRMVWDKLFFWGFAILGLGIGGYLIWDGWNSVERPPYCMIFEDDFTNGINPDNWNYEISVGGYGPGSFDWTTNDEKNAYTDERGLHIVPTLTTESTDITMDQMLDGYNLNLTKDGTCTESGALNCVAVSNATTGKIINPVRSARLNTKGKHSITYGKIEVVAKLPKGSWLWPAIWMMPEDSVYGDWPASGEIDIMESKGNDGVQYKGGRNLVGGTLHWAPYAILDAFYRTSGVRYLKRKDYSDGFHTYGMEWSENYIYTWVDTRIAQSMYIPFGKSHGTMYDRGFFSGMSVNGSIPLDPWSVTGRYNTPFDEAFYLILNVAVGANNGYFEDGYKNKPWVDGSATAAGQFLAAQAAWEKTWGEGDERGMTVKSVKMFNRGECAPNVKK